MLVLERAEGEAVWIGRNVRAIVKSVRQGNRVRLAFDAPMSVPILREELMDAPGQWPSVGRVLIIDDDPVHRTLMRQAAARAGVRTIYAIRSVERFEQLVGAFGGEDGLEPPDVVLCDYRLAGRSGPDAVRWLREQHLLGGAPIVMVSSVTDPRCIHDCIAEGANAFVQKSGDASEFIRRVQVTLEFWIEVATHVQYEPWRVPAGVT